MGRKRKTHESRNIHIFKDCFNQYTYLWLETATFDEVVQAYGEEFHIKDAVAELDVVEWGIRSGLMMLMTEEEESEFVNTRTFIREESCK